MRVYRMTPEIQAVGELLREKFPQPPATFGAACAEFNQQGWKLRDPDGQTIRVVLDTAEMAMALDVAWNIEPRYDLLPTEVEEDA